MNSEISDKSLPADGSRYRSLVITISILLVVFLITGFLVWRRTATNNTSEKTKTENKTTVESELVLSAEAITSSGIVTDSVTERDAGNILHVTGAVEANQLQTQQITPLVAGRLERVSVNVGDRVNAGTVLGTIASSAIAELRGKYHEEETHLAIAERKLERVEKTENRVAVLQSQARLNEAEATLNRTRRLVELDVVAKKDLITAETAYNVAKAEYEFQSNIVLTRDLLEAKAEVATAQVDLAHVRDQLRALGAPVAENENEDHKGNTSVIPIVSPIAGVVIERMVNAGAGIEANKPLFTIANISQVWIIASVPEAQVSRLQIGAKAQIHAIALGAESFEGKVSYIDPQLNETTRTARVRIDVSNPKEQLKVGMFTEVHFQTGSSGTEAKKQLFILAEAAQTVDGRTVIFLVKYGEAGHFEVKDVELGEEIEGYRPVIKGLVVGERIVTKGSFTLKTKMLKNRLEED